MCLGCIGWFRGDESEEDLTAYAPSAPPLTITRSKARRRKKKAPAPPKPPVQHFRSPPTSIHFDSSLPNSKFQQCSSTTTTTIRTTTITITITTTTITTTATTTTPC